MPTHLRFSSPSIISIHPLSFSNYSTPCVCVCVCVTCSVMSNSVTPWTVARQAPLSVGFSRWLPFPSPLKVGKISTVKSQRCLWGGRLYLASHGFKKYRSYRTCLFSHFSVFSLGDIFNRFYIGIGLPS